MKKKAKKSVKRVPAVTKPMPQHSLVTLWDALALAALLGTVLVLGKLAVDILGI